jgi:hypothetical protein
MHSCNWIGESSGDIFEECGDRTHKGRFDAGSNICGELAVCSDTLSEGQNTAFG